MSTYEFTLGSTPWYINHIHSPFWSMMAKEASAETDEGCKHTKKYGNFRVYCTKTRRNYIYIHVICNICKMRFDQTAREIQNNYLETYGF